MKTALLVLVLLLTACGGGDPDPCPGDAQQSADGTCQQPVSSAPITHN